MANRVWQHHFGRGLVATPSNFGRSGAAPTHPELLDWLANRFVESGWSVKALHRLIMSSRTYQLASGDHPANAAVDPDNAWHWRHDRRRLDAEALRDAMLAVSGRLDIHRPGEHPFPPIGEWGWTQHSPFKAVYASNHRSVYLMTQRIQRHPFLALFDGPDTNTSTDERTTATVPLQALFLMNRPLVAEHAAGFARRLISYSADGRERIAYAYALAFGRPPSAHELDKGAAYVEQYRRALAAAGSPDDALELEAWTSYARVLMSNSEFMYLD